MVIDNVRPATLADLEAVTAIYNYYVVNSTMTFRPSSPASACRIRDPSRCTSGSGFTPSACSTPWDGSSTSTGTLRGSSVHSGANSSQKRTFIPNWNSRALVAVLWMRPKELDEKSVTGTPRFTRSKMLKPSTRISAALFSPNGTRLMNDRSVLIMPVPATALRGALPDCPSGARWNAAVLNHCAAFFAPAFGSPTTFGRQLGVQLPARRHGSLPS